MANATALVAKNNPSFAKKKMLLFPQSQPPSMKRAMPSSQSGPGGSVKTMPPTPIRSAVAPATKGSRNQTGSEA